MLLAALLAVAAAPPAAEPSLVRLARAVAEQTAKASPEAPVAVHVEAPTPAMARAFNTLLSAELAARKLSPVALDAPSAAAAERLAREKDLRSLVRVTLTAENTRVVARGDLLPTWVNFWAGAAPTRAAGGAAALASTVDADAAALALAAIVGPATTAAAPLKVVLSPLAKLAAVPAALAIGDLDGDQKPEIGVLTDDELLIFAPDGRPLSRFDLRGLTPSSRPGREPFGALALSAAKVGFVSARRAHGELLGWSAAGFGRSAGQTDEVALDGVGVRLVPGLNAFAAEAQWFGKPVVLPAPLTTTNTRAGVSLFLFANGTGALSRGVPPAATFTQAPSAAVVADLDGDGTPELFASSARFFPDGDEVRVLPVAAVEAAAARGGGLSEVPAAWAGLTPRGRVVASAVGDLDGDGADDVVLGVWLADGTGELHVARKAAP